MGYYSDDTQNRPYVNVKTILYRNDPILCCAPQHKPVEDRLAQRHRGCGTNLDAKCLAGGLAMSRERRLDDLDMLGTETASRNRTTQNGAVAITLLLIIKCRVEAQQPLQRGRRPPLACHWCLV
jgi:hypothetical protein